MNVKSTLVASLLIVLLVVVTLFVVIDKPSGSLAAAGISVLSTRSSTEDILAVLDNAHLQYKSLHVQAVETQGGDAVRRIELWLLQPEAKFRLQLDDFTHPEQSTTTISDGVHMCQITSGVSTSAPGRPPLTKAIHPENVVPRPVQPEKLGFEENTVFPAWVNLAVGGPIGNLMAPTMLAQGPLRQSEIKIFGQDTIAGRDTLHITAKLWDGSTIHLWIDLATGVILQKEIYTDNLLQSGLTVESIEFDPSFIKVDELFSVE